MAELLEPTGEYAEANTVYPWDEWLDGAPRRIRPVDERGGDYTCDVSTMRTYLYLKARKRGLKLTVTVEPDDAIVFQAYDPGSKRPKLPSPFRRWANGAEDKTAPLKVAEVVDRACCTECGEALGTFAKSRGTVCRTVLNMEWRCTDGTPRPMPRGPR